MKEIYKSIIVELPLRGEWLAPNMPSKKIPSHGTDISWEHDMLTIFYK